jgi:hypothetical protein
MKTRKNSVDYVGRPPRLGRLGLDGIFNDATYATCKAHLRQV